MVFEALSTYRDDSVERSDRLDVFDIIILIVLAALILFSPLAMGSVAPWAKNAIFVLSLFVAALWILQAMKRGRLVLMRDPVYIFIGFFVLVVALQLVPLGPAFLEKISPATADVYRNTLAGYPETGEARTLSLMSYQSVWELRRIAALVLIFLVVMNTIRSRAQVLTLVLVMIAVGVFEAIYGFADFMAGGKSIFWNERIISGHRVSGTFINKNHFAGLLEMIVPVTLGLCMTAVPKRIILGGNLKVRAVEVISSTWLHRQILLGIVVVLMTMAIFFSLSRAGMTATVGAWIPFFLLMGLTTGSRRFTLTAVLLILAFLCVFFSADSGFVVDRVEETAMGESISWNARLDIWRSCMALISDFPLLGTGLGTFKEAFERYQSSLFGDKYVAFAHNDWLQIVCETGFLGGAAVIVGIVLLFLRLSRRTLERRDTFCRWIATGALAGCLAILIHSLFDFNLYKITSNGVVFAVILGLWHVTANMKAKSKGSRDRLRPGTFALHLRAKPARLAVSVAAVAMMVILTVPSVRSAMADIHFNRYLALTGTQLEQSRLYHFLPYIVDSGDSSSRKDAGLELIRARELDDRNPLYIFFEGVEHARQADAITEEKARSVANTILGSDPNRSLEDLLELEETLFSALVQDQDMASRRLPMIKSAERSVREAIDEAPAASLYHFFLADLVAESGGSSPSTGGEVSDTISWLAPNKPATLFHAGKSFLSKALAVDQDLETPSSLSLAFESFRRCISIDALYTDKIYPLILDTLGGTKNLFAVTPDTIGGYEQLTRSLQEAGEWEAALNSLDNMKRLCGLSVDTALRNESDLLDTQISISQRRTKVLEILGRYEDRKQESRLYHSLLGIKTGERLQKAYLLRGERRYSKAFALTLDILSRDCCNTDTLILAADLARMPGVIDEYLHQETSLDFLFRLVLLNNALRAPSGEKAIDALRELNPKSKSDRYLVDLVKGSMLVLSGKCIEGVAILNGITDVINKYKDREHLVQYFLGIGYEGRGMVGEARKAYEKVLKTSPAHRWSMERIIALDSNFLRDGILAMDYETDFDFGGRVRLLGYRLGKNSASDELKDSYLTLLSNITLLWELVGPTAENLSCSIDYLDENMNSISTEIIRFEKLKARSTDVFYCGQIIEQELAISGDTPRTEFIQLSVRSVLTGRIQADNGDTNVVMKVYYE